MSYAAYSAAPNGQLGNEMRLVEHSEKVQIFILWKRTLGRRSTVLQDYWLCKKMDEPSVTSTTGFLKKKMGVVVPAFAILAVPDCTQLSANSKMWKRWSISEAGVGEWCKQLSVMQSGNVLNIPLRKFKLVIYIKLYYPYSRHHRGH